MDKGVSVVVPVLNEERVIGKVIDDLVNVFRQAGITKYEIIAIDDGSTDGTRSIIASKNITVISHELNRGYGYALKSGIKSAVYENIVVIDGDGTYSADDIPALLGFADTYDMAVGLRKQKRFYHLSLRSIIKWFLTKLAVYLTETDIPDLNSGLRVFKKSIASGFFAILPSGFSFTTTITLAMINSGYRIKYVPIDYQPRRHLKSKFRPVRDTLNMFILILEIMVYYKPLKIFVPIFLILILSATATFFYSLIFLGKVLDATVLVLMFSALQFLSLGLIASLINKRGESK